MSYLPVRIDWSTLSVVDLMEVNLISAGTLSPTNRLKKKKKAANVSNVGSYVKMKLFPNPTVFKNKYLAYNAKEYPFLSIVNRVTPSVHNKHNVDGAGS